MSMFACEREVIDLWDAGKSIETIVTLTGKSRHYVSKIVWRYHIENDGSQLAGRRGSQLLLAAIQRAGLAA